MDVLVGALHLVSVVILVGGAAKVASPDAFAALLRSLGLPHRRFLAQLAGVAEILLGATVLVVGGPWAAGAVAIAYAVFAVVVLLARRSGAASCGCFGAAAAPPSIVHVLVNATSAAIALAAAAGGGAPWLGEVLSDQPLLGVPYLAVLAIGTWLVITLDTVGASVLDGISNVAALGPTFRDNASSPRSGHRGGTHVHR